MSNRYIEPIQILPTQTINVGTYTSLALNMKSLPRGGIEIVYDANISATFSIQGSVSGQNFEDLGIAVAPAAMGAGVAVIDLSQYGLAFFRCVVTCTAGPGVLTVWGNAKG